VIKFSKISVYLNKLKITAPEIRFHIQCYHYIRVRNNRGKMV